MGKTLEYYFNSIDNGYINFDKNRIGNIFSKWSNVVVIISDERENLF